MGQKTHPLGFRLGIIKDWKAHWYSQGARGYSAQVKEDLRIREIVKNEYKSFSDAGISRVEIDRGSQDGTINIHTARPGILIGRDGDRVKSLRGKLEGVAGKRIQLNIIEVEKPEINAVLIGKNIAEALGRRVAYRRAMRQAALRCMQGGAKGVKIHCKGRIGGAEIARVEKLVMGSVPLHTLRADVEFSIAEAYTAMGVVGIKVWVYSGDILPSLKERQPEEELETIELNVTPTSAADLGVNLNEYGELVEEAEKPETPENQ
jgi:small subunit ribosomal protein S3